MKKLRKSFVASTFYPDNAKELRSEVNRYLSQSRKESLKPIKFLIVPHAGYYYSGKTAGAGFAEITDGEYERIVLIGPSHRYSFNGLRQSGVDIWQSPLGETRIEQISSKAFPLEESYHIEEHSLEVEVPFLQQQLPEARMIPLLVSGPLSSAEFLASQLIELDTEKTLWVISSDFNHTGPSFQYFPHDFGYNSGREIDQEGILRILRGDINNFCEFLSETKSTICGALPILIAMNIMKHIHHLPFRCKQYSCSQDLTLDENSVGYAALYS